MRRLLVYGDVVDTPEEASRERWLVAATEYAGLTPYTGGIGRHYAALLPALAASGAEVDLVIAADAAALPGADLDGVRLVSYARTDGARNPLRVGARAVADVYGRGRYDRVFLPEWAALGAALPRRAPLLTNLATSAQLANEVSGLRIRDLPRDRRPIVRRQIAAETRQIRRSAGLVSISHAMLERTRSLLGRLPPSAVVPNCIDVAAVRAAAAGASLPEGWPTGDGPVVLFLGRSERRKGVVEAVQAFGRVSSSRPALRLVLAGAGGDARFEPTRKELLGMLPPAARERVTWLGHVPGDGLYAAVRASAVVLCPSRWEGFGQVALEVKAAGAPLVATSGSGYDDFCVDGLDAVLVPPRDPGALATGIERVLADPDATRARIARAGERVEAFAPAPVATRLRAAADGLLGRRGL
jgi:glycogen(starch) synthase